MKTALTKTTILASLLVVASAWMIQSCSGDDGSAGAPGAAGAGCTSEPTANGMTITCPGSAPITIKNGTDGAGGCTINPTAQGQLIQCGSQSATIPPAGSGSSANCSVIMGSDLDHRGVDNQGGSILTIDCGGNKAMLGLCGSDRLLFNPSEELCDEAENSGAGAILKGVRNCAGETDPAKKEYVMSTHFCQNNTADDDSDDPTGLRVLPKCGGQPYAVNKFCLGTTDGDNVPSSKQSVATKCFETVTGSTYKISQFCMAVGSSYKITDLCGYGVSTVNDGAGRDYTENQFCQKDTYATPNYCGKAKYTYEAGDICSGTGDDATLTLRCGSDYYTKNWFFCPNGERFVRCSGIDEPNGEYDFTTKFCYNDFSSDTKKEDNTNRLDANTNGVLKDLCKKFIPAELDDDGKVVTAATFELKGYAKNQFCAKTGTNKDGKGGAGYIYPLCRGANLVETSATYGYNPDDRKCQATVAGTAYTGVSLDRYGELVTVANGGGNGLVLVGKCGGTAVANEYNAAEYMCLNDELRGLCGATSFDLRSQECGGTNNDVISCISPTTAEISNDKCVCKVAANKMDKDGLCCAAADYDADTDECSP